MKPGQEPVAIINFWYAPENRPLWFKSTPDFDAVIKKRFENTWQNASKGKLKHWLVSPEGYLALAIVLDQFPLNMYRGQALSFATLEQAIRISRDAVDKSIDQQLVPEMRVFLYMPLMHSERLEDQKLSVELFSRSSLLDNLRFARHHRALIERFGRFPHRNELIGRVSTPEEIAYLTSKEAFRG